METNLQKGQVVLVRNSNNEPWKVKLFSKYSTGAGEIRSKYYQSHPYKVHNKTGTDRAFSFKQCVPFPVATVSVGV